MNRNIHPLTGAIATLILASTLTACGSGGGSKSDPTPGPIVDGGNNGGNNGGNGGNGGNNGGGTPPTPTPTPDPYAYKGIEDNVLIPTGIKKAQDAGFTGAGVKLAVLDGGLLGSYAPLDGRLTESKDFTGQPADNPTGTKASHGMLVAAFAGGKATDSFKGGAAPGADLYLGRVCAADNCNSAYVAAAVGDFAAKGVKIFNMSFGAKSSEIVVPAYAAAAEAIVKNGALAIVATGNEGASEPNAPANYPTLAAGYDRNWLAVGNVSIGADGKPTGLDPTSNLCGGAAAFCLVAPGSNTMQPVPGSDSANFNIINGTSISTAIVSGVAAQVWQAFPWMSANNVQQTLLTTATDLGDAGVDAKFGWGLVNADKAVKGPAAFMSSWGVGVTGDSTFSNNISGTGSLTKGGSGRLTLSGANTYTGSTTVLDGTLNLTGSITSNVLVGNSATFETHGGKIDGSYGVINTTGNTAIELGKPLTVTRTVDLKGNLILLPETGDYKVATSEKILSSGVLNGVKGTFDNVKYANGFFWTAGLSYQPQAVYANLTRASATASALSIGAPQSVVDGAKQADALVAELDQRAAAGATAASDPMLATGAALLSAGDAAAAASLTSLTGQIHGTQRTLALQAGLNDLTNAADRLPSIRSTARTTLWAQAEGVEGDLDRDGYAKAKYNTRGITIGLDAPIGTSGTIVGVALTGSRTKGNIAADASRLESDRKAMTAYAFQPLGSAYASATLSYGKFDVDTVRTLAAGNVQERVKANRDDSILSGRIEAGYNVGQIAPFVAVGALRQRQGSFNEAAASGLGLAAGSDSLTTQFGEIGLRNRFASGAWSFDSGIAYRAVFSGRNTGFNAWFNGLPGTDFTVAGQNVSKDNLRVFIGTTYTASPGLSIYGNVTAERGGAGQSNAAGNLGFRWAF